MNAISPGFIETPIFDAKTQNDPHFFEKLGNLVPLKRTGKNQKILHMLLHFYVVKKHLT